MQKSKENTVLIKHITNDWYLNPGQTSPPLCPYSHLSPTVLLPSLLPMPTTVCQTKCLKISETSQMEQEPIQQTLTKYLRGYSL